MNWGVRSGDGFRGSSFCFGGEFISLYLTKNGHEPRIMIDSICVPEAKELVDSQ